MKKADVLDLIKYHFENKEAEFRNQAITIARSFDKAGDSQLAQYIIGLISQSDRFVPQNNDVTRPLSLHLTLQDEKN